MRFPAKIFSFIKRLDFLFILCLNIALFSPFLNNKYMPGDDTLFHFQNFYYLYNHLFYQNSWALWSPFILFGTPVQLYQLMSVTPLNYLFIFLGKVTQTQNVLVLFKLSILTEQLVFLTGLYVLFSSLFKSRWTRFLLCLTAINGLSYWHDQLPFDFHIYYLLPLTLYTFLKFFEKKDARYFWWTAVLGALWLIGTAGYYAALWFLIFLIVGLVLLTRDIKVLKSFKRFSIQNLCLSLLFVGLVGIYVYQFKFQDPQFQLDCRTDGLNLSLANFLTYGGPSDGLSKLLIHLTSLNFPQGYIGVLPLIFFIWSVFTVRSRIYFAFLLSSLSIMGIWFQGLVAVALFLSPGMFIYHHTQLLYVILKILILICCGFGLENFLKTPAPVKIRNLALIAGGITLFLDGLGITSRSLADIATDETLQNSVLPLWFQTHNAGGRLLFYLIAAFLIMAWALVHIKCKPKTSLRSEILVTYGFILFFLADILFNGFLLYRQSYQSRVVKEKYLDQTYIVYVHKPAFIPFRLMKGLTQRQNDALTIGKRKTPANAVYATIHNMAQSDVCFSLYRSFIKHKSDALLKKFRLRYGKDFFKLSGCNTPKLRLFAQGEYFPDRGAALEKMNSGRLEPDKVILSAGDRSFADTILPQGAPHADPGDQIRLKDFSANELVLEAEVKTKPGAWLVYADNYSPNWHATIDNKRSPIYEAFLFSKAVWLDSGKHVVRFFYHSGLAAWNNCILFLVGIVSGLSFIFLILRIVYLRMESRWE